MNLLLAEINSGTLLVLAWRALGTIWEATVG